MSVSSTAGGIPTATLEQPSDDLTSEEIPVVTSEEIPVATLEAQAAIDVNWQNYSALYATDDTSEQEDGPPPVMVCICSHATHQIRESETIAQTS